MNEPRSAASVSVSEPLCDRVTCSSEASVLLLFDPRTTAAWLSDILSDTRLVGIALCLDHANRVTVPAGWTLTDERSGTNRVRAPRGKAKKAKKASPPATDPSAGEPDPAPVRLATVTPMPDTRTDSDSDVAPDDAPAADADVDGHDLDDSEVPADDPEPEDEPDVAEPRLWSDDQPESLQVDESTPMLSRAFRAAHID